MVSSYVAIRTARKGVAILPRNPPTITPSVVCTPGFGGVECLRLRTPHPMRQVGTLPRDDAGRVVKRYL